MPFICDIVEPWIQRKIEGGKAKDRTLEDFFTNFLLHLHTRGPNSRRGAALALPGDRIRIVRATMAPNTEREPHPFEMDPFVVVSELESYLLPASESAYDRLKDSAFNIFPYDLASGDYLKRAAIPEDARRREGQQFFITGGEEGDAFFGFWINKIVYSPKLSEYPIDSKGPQMWR